MFKPNFRYTNKIVTLIGKIAASREIVLNSPLVPKWEVSLRREAIIRSAHSSTSIEGNKLSLTQVSQGGFDTKRFFSLDDYYDSDRQAYYKALQTVDRDVRDLTNWLEYFVEGVAVSLEAVKERVVRLSSERLRARTKGQIALTEKQMRIVEFINQNERISNKDVQELLKIARQNALVELVKLLKLGVIKPVGKGRALHYILK